MYGRTNPEIVGLFWIENILKSQKHFISVRHWLFSMTLKNNFDVHQSGYKQFMSSLVQSVFNSLYIWLWTSKRYSVV